MLRSSGVLEPGGPCVLAVEGDFDNQVIPEVQDAVTAALGNGCDGVLLDLTGVDFIDSSALGFILWADSRVRPSGGRVALAGANPDVARILELSGLVGLAPTVVLTGSVEDALRTGKIDTDLGAPLWVESLEFPSDPAEVSAARTRVGEMLAPLALPGAVVFDVKVAVGEALTNAVRHGSPQGRADTVAVEVRAYDDRIVIVVSDRGAGFDGAAPEDSDAYAPGGRGVLFMRALMDAVEFVRSDAGGTSVVLAKRRSLES